MKLLLIIFVIALLALLAWVVAKMAELDEREEELDKYSVHLDERANMLARWEQELKDWSPDFSEFTTIYVETESDHLMHTQDSAISKAARKQLSSTIAGDIMRRFAPDESVNADGRKVYTYKLRVKKL